MIDTWHSFRQLALELPRWAPYTAQAIFLHDTLLFRSRDEGDEGHGGKPVDAAQYAGVGGGAGLEAAVAGFLNSPEGAEWELLFVRQQCHGLTVLRRTRGLEGVLGE